MRLFQLPRCHTKASFQVALNRWFRLVVWGFDPSERVYLTTKPPNLRALMSLDEPHVSARPGSAHAPRPRATGTRATPARRYGSKSVPVVHLVNLESVPQSQVVFSILQTLLQKRNRVGERRNAGLPLKSNAKKKGREPFLPWSVRVPDGAPNLRCYHFGAT